MNSMTQFLANHLHLVQGSSEREKMIKNLSRKDESSHNLDCSRSQLRAQTGGK